MSLFFFFSSRRRHTRWPRDWSSDVCSSDLVGKEDELINYDEIAEVAEREKPKMITVGASAYSRVIEIGRASCRERVELLAMGIRLSKIKKKSLTTRQVAGVIDRNDTGPYDH